ncbi:MAG TPA: PHP domain-containing protein [Acidimicrobiales bacterium]|nr:PHP domain-containing protein [Acidimicrobiales bacterium]
MRARPTIPGGVLDYHLHLWPHGERHRQPSLEELAAYCDAASEAGVEEIALTEHLFRFVQADAPLGDHWRSDPENPHLQRQAAEYWREHNGADLDAYVDAVLDAKAAGLPVVLGLEVDFYAGRMDRVRALLDGYPFDVLLGSVHWIGAWLFDVLESSVAQREWDERGVEAAWSAYVDAIEELAACGAVDVLAHPDLCKVAGRVPGEVALVAEAHDRIAEAAASAGLAAEVSSAGWRKPCDEQYPAPGLLERFRQRDVGITTASDAHSLDLVAFRVGDVREVVERAGYTELVRFRARRPERVAL